MTAVLGVVALAGVATVSDEAMAAGIRSLGGFAPFGADELRMPAARWWVARSFHGTGVAEWRGCVLALDGRLRDGAAFRRRHRIDDGCGDAEALLRAYADRDVHLFDDLDADLALVLLDPARRRVVLYRDPLGERGLRYVREGDRLFVSSRGSALLALRGERLQPDDTAMAHFFALRAPPDDVAWMHGVRELPAGGLLIIDDGRERQTRIVPALPSSPLRFRSDDAAADAWRDTVAQAVARAGADAATSALMLSGGIDSTLLASCLDPARSLAVSWAVPHLPDCDESALAAATAAQLRLRHVRAPDGSHEPLSDLPSWPMEDEAPLANPYRRLNQALFAAARAEGATVLLSGNFGDHIYADGRDWPASFVRERGMLAFVAELVVQTARQRFALRHDPGVRGLLSWLRPSRTWVPDWLTDTARDRLPDTTEQRGWPRRVEEAFGRASAQDAELARRYANAHGLELRFPYRDPALLAFVLGLPAHYSDSARGPKWLSRQVLSGRVPESVRLRPKLGSLTPLFQWGVLDRHRAEVERLLLDADARWPRYIDRDALMRALASPESDAQLLPIWLAISFELWWRAHWAAGPAVLASRQLSSENR